MSDCDIKLGSVQETSATQDTAADSFPWPQAAATGIGSMPGRDPAEACAVVLGELPDFPYLPELPGRSVGADMVGRTASLLVDMPVETTPRGWKFAAKPGRDQRRADSFLLYDLDALQVAADGYTGPLKISVCGPLTLAASIELSRSQNVALSDPGALADLTASLAEGAAAHVRAVQGRIPGAQIVVQVDEPALTRVLGGGVPTASGLSRIAALDPVIARPLLASVLTAVPAPAIVHCCAARLPFSFLREAGAGALSFDLSLLRGEDTDAIAELAEAGVGLLAGAVPAVADQKSRPVPARQYAADVVTLWRRTTLDPRLLARQVVITPACGLAGATPDGARAALELCREAARIAPEMIEGEAR
jgi:methionine synthase II (cobalamin-independent)